MDPELLKLILAQMNASGSSDLGGLLGMGTAPSPSSLSGAMNPETLVALGLLNPQSINAGVDAQLAELMTEYAKKNAPAPVKFEASPAVFQQSLGQWGIQPQVSPDGRLAQFNENTGNKAQDVVAAGLNAIASGKLTAEQLQAGLAQDILDNPDDYKGIQDASSLIQRTWKDFESQYKDFGNAVAKYQYETAQGVTQAGPAPTRQQAMNEYYKSIGAPQLSLLGDPSATYQFDPLTFADPAKIKALSEAVGRADTVVSRETNRVPKGMVSESEKLRQSYTAKGIEDTARAYAEKVANSKVDVASRAGAIARGAALGTTVPFLGTGLGALIGYGVGTARQSKEKGEWRDAYQQAYEREKARLEGEASKAPAVTAETLSGDLSLAKAKQYTAQKALNDELAFNQQVADLVSQGLAARGKTPFNQNLQQILAYATTPKKK